MTFRRRHALDGDGHSVPIVPILLSITHVIHGALKTSPGRQQVDHPAGVDHDLSPGAVVEHQGQAVHLGGDPARLPGPLPELILGIQEVLGGLHPGAALPVDRVAAVQPDDRPGSGHLGDRTRAQSTGGQSATTWAISRLRRAERVCRPAAPSSQDRCRHFTAKRGRQA